MDGLQLRSLITTDGELVLSLQRVAIAEPAADEVVVRVEATPINPSDIWLLLGAADMDTATVGGTRQSPVVTATVPPSRRHIMAGRAGASMPVGNEGAGVVVQAGANAQHLLGKTVAMLGGAMYAEYRSIAAADCLELPQGTAPIDGASCFINPLTVLGMVETMRREGHTALVHTAAASSLGQMLNRICIADSIPLVNIVRSSAQAEVLRALGAKHICDSGTPSFKDDLIAALATTGATLAFDAIGGGKLAGQILAAMEVVASRDAKVYSRYGSAVHKQVYVYGTLGTGPIELSRAFGMAWGVGGWLLPSFLQKIGPAETARLRGRVAREIKTTFASHYAHTISLAGALQLDTIAAYRSCTTGRKYIINPALRE